MHCDACRPSRVHASTIGGCRFAHQPQGYRDSRLSSEFRSACNGAGSSSRARPLVRPWQCADSVLPGFFHQIEGVLLCAQQLVVLHVLRTDHKRAAAERGGAHVARRGGGEGQRCGSNSASRRRATHAVTGRRLRDEPVPARLATAPPRAPIRACCARPTRGICRSCKSKSRWRRRRP